MLEIEAGHIDSAVHELEQNILIDNGDSDPEALENRAWPFALCCTKAPPRCRSIIAAWCSTWRDISITSPIRRSQCARAYQLADSYRQLSSHDTINRNASGVSEKMNEETFDHFLQLNKRSWTRAVEEFTKLEELIKKPQLATLLSLYQQAEISFHVAKGYYELGEYEKACENTKNWRKSGMIPRALFALGGTIRCFATVKDFKAMRERAEMIRGMLDAIPGLTDANRQQWNEWLKIVTAKYQAQESDSHRESARPSPVLERQLRDVARLFAEASGRNDASAKRR